MENRITKKANTPKRISQCGRYIFGFICALGMFPYPGLLLANPPGTLFGHSSNRFLSIDTATGVVTHISDVPISGWPLGDPTAIDPINGRFFVVSGNRIWTIDTSTGAVISNPVLSQTPLFIQFDSGTGTLFGHSSNRFLSIDTATGVVTHISDVPISGWSTGDPTAIDPINGRFFVVSGNRIWTIDTSTGVVMSNPVLSQTPIFIEFLPGASCTPVSIDSLTAYPLVVQLGNAVNFEAIIVDGCGEIDALWDFDDGTVDPQTNVASPVTTTKTYASAGVYTVVLTVSDDEVDDGDNIVVVVYDPTGGGGGGGFVTGAGWIDSLAGAYKPDLSLTGKATFAFMARYQKGATVPTGNTRFIFKNGDLHFHSTGYDWLVVTGSNYARFKGTGTINGSGEYRFMIWAGDNDPDTFRIRIWEEDENGYETDVYDNGFDQEIMGGNIVIHD